MRGNFTIQKPSMQICFHKGDVFLCPFRHNVKPKSIVGVAYRGGFELTGPRRF
jgi:hypothetical protein